MSSITRSFLVHRVTPLVYRVTPLVYRVITLVHTVHVSYAGKTIAF